MLSLCMIVKNEENVLARCLDSVRDLADEIVIVDTGSHDRTAEIAKKYADRVEFHPWIDDFSEARNFSFSLASEEYLMWLDADDFIDEENAARLKALKERLEKNPADTVMCGYRSGGLFYERERVVRRCPHAKWRGHVHECIPPFGKIVHDPFTVLHLGNGRERGGRNLEIYRKWERSEPLSARDLFYYARELYYEKLYAEAEEKLQKMLVSEGWYVNKIEACDVLSRCREESGDVQGAILALFRSFLYGEPRAGVCFRLGELFKAQKKYREAVFWFRSALSCGDHSAEGDFERPDCRGISPALELVVTFDLLGDRKNALFWHERTKELAPDHPSVLHNERYFNAPKGNA